MSDSDEWYKRMLVLEDELESLKHVLQAHREIFNDIHNRMANIEQKIMR